MQECQLTNWRECGVVVIVHGHDGCGASVRCGLGNCH